MPGPGEPTCLTYFRFSLSSYTCVRAGKTKCARTRGSPGPGLGTRAFRHYKWLPLGVFPLILPCTGLSLQNEQQHSLHSHAHIILFQKEKKKNNTKLFTRLMKSNIPLIFLFPYSRAYIFYHHVYII